MNLKYTIDDLKSLYNFIKANPNSSFEEWEDYNNKILTEEERDWFKFIEIATIDIPSKSGKDNHLHIIKWNGVHGGCFEDPFRILMRKFFRESYLFYNGGYGEHALFTTTDDGDDYDLFNEENFSESKDFKGVIEQKIILGDVEILINNNTELVEEDAHRFGGWEDTMSRNNYHFWTEGHWEIYINDIHKLEFKPVLDFLKL